MTEEELSKLTGVDPLWVHITPCLAMSTVEQAIAKQRSDGIPLVQLREQFRDQLARYPQFEGIIDKLYGIDEAAIPDEIRERHDACVSKIVGISPTQVDACYEQNYADFLRALFGDHSKPLDQIGTRRAYTACLKAAKG